MYKTLTEVVAAFKSGELGETTESFAWLDNDDVSIYKGDEKVYQTHPYQLLEDALDLLGIPWEHV